VPSRHTPAPGQARHLSRDLCSGCYDYARRHGTLDDHRRIHRPLAETIEDWEFLASQGVDRDEAARQLGIAPVTLRQAIQRWNRRHDLTHTSELEGAAA